MRKARVLGGIVIAALGVGSTGWLGEVPLIVAFVILAAFTYTSGLRAPAAIAPAPAPAAVAATAGTRKRINAGNPSSAMIIMVMPRMIPTRSALSRT